MAETNNTKQFPVIVATTASRVKDLVIKDGQLIFMREVGRIAFDFKGQRVFYNQIVELETESARQSLESPIPGYYFVIDKATLWFYQDGWVQITHEPKEVVFIGVELPELGSANTLYVDKQSKNISVWDDETKHYVVVADTTSEISEEYIDSLFNN